jgi:chloramphenicol-sensitive protein RarD
MIFDQMNSENPAISVAQSPGALPYARHDMQHLAAVRVGVLYGVGAYSLWGVFPLYFKAIKAVPPLEVLAHRVVWSLLFLLLLLGIRGGLRTAVTALRSRKALAILSVTTLLIAGNWLVFIWAVANDRVLEASLGYFINPLVNVLLGFVFLRERLRPIQTVSVVLATGGVTYMAAGAGHFPAVALFLAATFGFYGLLRKIAPVEALVGLTVETGLLTPLALGFLMVEMARGEAVFGGDSVKLNVLLLLAGVVTATPLLWFAQAARRLRLATMGFLQYLAPTGHLLLAVLAFGEPFTQAHLVTFGCIWTALVLYSVDAWRSRPVVVAAPE